jgi:rhodanese-related sulfurtransferase
MQHITPSILQQWITDGKAFVLVDVREDIEHTEFNIGGQLVPLGDVVNQPEKFEAAVPVVVYCRKGVRSQIAIQRLEQKFGFTHLVNLTGGVDRWRKEMAQ